MKRKEMEIIKTAIAMAEKILNTAVENDGIVLDDDFGRYVREWYINSRNTLPYMLRVSVLATFKTIRFIEGEEYRKPLPEAVYENIPDVVNRLKHRLPMYITYSDEIEYEPGIVLGYEWKGKIF